VHCWQDLDFSRPYGAPRNVIVETARWFPTDITWPPTTNERYATTVKTFESNELTWQRQILLIFCDDRFLRFDRDQLPVAGRHRTLARAIVAVSGRCAVPVLSGTRFQSNHLPNGLRRRPNAFDAKLHSRYDARPGCSDPRVYRRCQRLHNDCRGRLSRDSHHPSV
jgi:hypothetical protein